MQLAEQSDAAILAVVEPIMDRLMAASTAIDYRAHVEDFSERAKSMLSEAQFQAICRDYQHRNGYFVQREQVAIFRRPDSVAVVWKQFFSRQAGEYVAEMVLIEDQGRYLVDHVMVF